MRKIQKRILSLALPLFVILISGLTFAASPEAAIGKTKYETLENAVKKGETIRLLKNIRCDEGKFYELRKNTSYSIDFSTFKIQKLGGNPAVDTGSAFVIRKGKVSFENMVISAKRGDAGEPLALKVAGGICVIRSGMLSGPIRNEGTLYLKGGSFKGLITNSGELEITSGSYRADLMNEGRMRVRGGEYRGKILMSPGARTSVSSKVDVTVEKVGWSTRTASQAKIIEGMKAYAKRQIGRHAYFSVLYLDPNTMPAIWYSDSRKFEAYSYYMFTNVYCADYGSMKLYYQIVKNAIRPKSLTEEEALAITRKTKAVQVPIYALTAKNIEKYVK